MTEPRWKVELAPSARDRLVELPRPRRRTIAETLDHLAEQGPPALPEEGRLIEVEADGDRIHCLVEPAARRLVVIEMEETISTSPSETASVLSEGSSLVSSRGSRAWMSFLASDLRLAVRSLIARPGFALVAFTTLVLGLAVNAALFGLLREVVLRPLPFEEPARLVVIETVQGGDRYGVTWADFLDVAERSELLARVGATYRPGMELDIALQGAVENEAVDGRWATAGFFQALGVEPAIGRSFTSGHDVLDEVMVSYGAWQRRWGGDPDIVGTALTINGRPRVVTGVLPAAFEYRSAGSVPELWVRSPDNSQLPGDRVAWVLEVVARLADGVDQRAAEAELEAIATEIAPLFADRDPGWTLATTSLHESLVGDVAPVLWVLLLAGGALMLVVCANLAGLSFARNTARRRELAVRAALGAGRGQIVRQLAVEGSLVAGAAAILGILLAPVAARLALQANPVSLPRLTEAPPVDPWVAGYTLAVAALSMIVFATLPAWRATGSGIESALRDGSRSVAGGTGRRWLLGLEAALVAVLLVGAGLALQSLDSLASVDPGFDAHNRLVMRVSLSAADAPTEAARQFFDEAERRLPSLPGVRAAGSVTNLPLYPGSWSGSLYMPDRDLALEGDRPQVNWEVASPGYFEAAGVPLLQGRLFSAEDRADTELVTVVNDAMARRFWPEGDALGRLISGNGPEGPWRRIIGIVGNVRQRALEEEPRPHMYVLHRQIYPFPDRELIVATEGVAPESVASAVRAELLEIDSSVTVERVRAMSALVDEALAGARFGGLLLTLLATTGLVLGLTGVYAIVAWFVEQRVRELGVRMALGAESRDILTLALGRGVAPVAVGAVVGIGLAAIGSRAIAGLLYGVSPLDPVTYATVIALMCVAAGTAALLPARRATRIDPATALRAGE